MSYTHFIRSLLFYSFSGCCYIHRHNDIPTHDYDAVFPIVSAQIKLKLKAKARKKKRGETNNNSNNNKTSIVNIKKKHYRLKCNYYFYIYLSFSIVKIRFTAINRVDYNLCYCVLSYISTAHTVLLLLLHTLLCLFFYYIQ